MKDIKNAMKHLKEHQMYPANKQQLVETCNELSDFSKEDKKWFKEHLPEGEYNSPTEVMGALGWDEQMMQTPPSM